MHLDEGLTLFGSEAFGQPQPREAGWAFDGLELGP